MKEYICIDDTYKSLNKDERKIFLKFISKSMHYIKAEIYREFWEAIMEVAKPKYVGEKSINGYTFSDIMEVLKETEQGKVKEDCNNCANSIVDFNNEVDTGCYMCCKGLENNYIPINTENRGREMKEYICKEDLFYSGAVDLDKEGKNWGIVESLSTITKDDIRKEVIEKIIKEFELYCGKQMCLIPKGVWEILYKAKETERSEEWVK